MRGRVLAPLTRRVRSIGVQVLVTLVRAIAAPLRPPAGVATPAGNAPSRILVIKPDHLGDVLLMTPALQKLRHHCPSAQIVVLVGPWSAPILARNPIPDAVLTLPFPGFERGGEPRSRLRPYLTLLRYALLLRGCGFAYALLMRDDHWWGAALAMAAGIPQRIGYAVPVCRPFLTTAHPWNPAAHVSAQALALVGTPANADHDAAHYRTHYTPAPADSAWCAAWLAQHSIGAEALLVVIHPGTGGASKLWLPQRWAAVADWLAHADARVRVVFTGGTAEQPLVAAIREQMHTPALTLAGATSIGQLAALFGRAVLVAGVDSGPLHLAVSQGSPTVHLYGASDAARFGPWGNPERHQVLRSGLWCSPCGVFAQCPRGTNPPECMEQISVVQVASACRRALQAGRGAMGSGC